MSSKKDIQNHINQLMNEAEKPEKLVTSSSFMDDLNAELDRIDAATSTKQAAIFSFVEIRKYAAVVLILILNAVVILSFGNSDQTQQEPEFSEYADEYFPNYATLTLLEQP